MVSMFKALSGGELELGKLLFRPPDPGYGLLGLPQASCLDRVQLLGGSALVGTVSTLKRPVYSPV